MAPAENGAGTPLKFGGLRGYRGGMFNSFRPWTVGRAIWLSLVWIGVWLALLAVAPRAGAELLARSTTVRGAPSEAHYFGDSVAIDRDTMVAATSSNKIVYVFKRAVTGWSLESQFTADYPDTIFGDVRLAGDILTVGNAVYVRFGATWSKQFTLPISRSRAIAIWGDRIVVGDADDGNEGSYGSADGAVHVYVRSGSTWTHEAKLVPDAPRNEGMGYTVAFDGETIVAMPDPFVGASATYVFARNGGGWQQQARLEPPAGGQPGWACAVEGEWLALGDPRANFVYLYQRAGGNWSYVQTVGAGDGDRDFFGAELCLSDGVLAVLAERVTTWPTRQTRLAGYLFVRNSSGWVQVQRTERAGGVIWGSLGLTKRAVVLGDGSDSGVAYYGGSATIFDTPAPPPPGSGWQSVDIGMVGLAGSSSGGESTASVSGSGSDIWGRVDAFHYRTETMTGDGTIVARVTGLTNTDGFAKAGIMFREDVAAGAREVMMLATPANNISFQHRSERGGDTQFVIGAYAVPAAWLMLSRTGNQFSGYRSNDGTNWTLVGTTTIQLEATIHVGLAVTSHNNSALATGTFADVDLLSSSTPPPPPPPPPGWNSADIGAVAIAGSTTVAGDTVTVRGSGADIWGTQDAFHFASRTLAGNGTLVVHVASLQNTHGWAKAGLMLRDGTAAGARNVMILARPDNTVSFQYRAAAGGESSFTMGSWNLASVWLMLTRAGDTFEGFESVDGTNWRKVGAVTIAMPASLLAGLAVTSHDNAQLTTAVFDNFDLVTSSPPPPPPSGGDWQSAKIGDGLAGSWSMADGVFTVSGSGSDVWGTSDSFRFVHRTLAGDGEIVARLAQLAVNSGTHPIAKAGVMLRDSLAPNAAYSFLFLTPRDLIALEGRTTAGASATRATTLYDRLAPEWLKLARSGATVTAAVSDDGVTWVTVGTQTLPAGVALEVGLAVCAHDATRTETGQFDSVSVTPSGGGAQ